MSSRKLVSVAIDFGTTFSGYAFSFRHEKETIGTFLWEARNFASVKTPTCILFDQWKRFHSFGLEAEENYAEISKDDEADSWYFFKQFKLALHNTKGLGRSTMIKEKGKKEMPALVVFTESIRYLKDHALHQLNMTEVGGVPIDEVQWVLTIPAIWDDSARQFMRLAAEKAGILENDLTLAFEPEAASVYCKTLERGTDIFKTIGTKYLVLDCGGGTVDIAVHEVEYGGKLKAIYRPSGGIWGGTKVDDEFQAFLAKICGMLAMMSLSIRDMIEIQRAFETAKTKVTLIGQNCIHIKLPVSLLSNINTEDSDGSYRLTGDKLSLSPSLMRRFFDKSIKKIKQHIETMLEEPVLSGVRYIIMVGGFAKSEVLQDAIKKGFPRLDVRTVQHADSAVVRGAVIYGHEPKIIKWRRSAFTYGTDIAREFQEDDDKRKLFYVDGVAYCNDIFERLVKINESLEVGKHKITRNYSPIYRDQKRLSLAVYRSSDPNPKYTTDFGCTRVGSLTVELPDNSSGTDRAVDTTFEFADTEIKVEAVNRNTGVKFTARFDFMAS